MNMLDKYLIIADSYKEKMLQDPRVEGIMYLGGLARGFADEFSDIDFAVFSSEALLDLQLGEQPTAEGYDLEVFHINMSEGFKKWTPIQKEAYEEGIIVTDKSGKVAKFMNEALEYSNGYRIKRALEIIFDIAWHGWVYTPYKNKNTKGYNWILPEDLWFRRDDYQNAFYITQVCIAHLLDLMFVINKKWTPDYKWRYLKMKNLDILPKLAECSFEFLLFEAWRLETWDKKREIMQKLVDDSIEILLSDLPNDNWYDILDH